MVAIGMLLTAGAFGLLSLIRSGQTPLPYQANGITASWIPASVRKWEPQITEAAKKYNLDPNLIAIIMTIESGGNPNAKSGAGAQGLMQITPPTAKDIAAKFLKESRTDYDIYDPKTNIEFGAAYLSYLRKEFGEAEQRPSWNITVELVAAGYNGGPGAANSVYKGEGLNDTETVVYARDAFNMWRERRATKSPTFDRWKERGGDSLIKSAQ